MHHLLTKLIEFGVSLLFEKHHEPPHGRKRREYRSWVPAVIGLGLLVSSWHGARIGAHDVHPEIQQLKDDVATLRTEVQTVIRLFPKPGPTPQSAANVDEVRPRPHVGRGPWIEAPVTLEARGE